jgi:membrane associated rhomboid family serine protease
MLPLRDDNPTRRPPFITLAIIAANIAAFLLWQPTFGTANEQQTFFFCNALIPYEVTHQTNLADGGSEARRELQEQLRGESEAEAREDQQFLDRQCGDKSWWQSIFVAMFLHGGWLHIGGNMLFLWIFGNNVEDKLGIVAYPLFYIVSGIAATAAQIALSPDSIIPNVGASGAIAGVLGAYLFMFPRRRILTLIIFFFITFVYLPAWLVLGGWFILQLFSGVGELGREVGGGGGVAFWAHIGGFVFGALAAILFFPKERYGALPPPRRPDYAGRRWGFRGRGPSPPAEDEGWRPY